MAYAVGDKKFCPGCSLTKKVDPDWTLSEFPRNKATGDGWDTYCKECTRARLKRMRAERAQRRSAQAVEKSAPVRPADARAKAEPVRPADAQPVRPADAQPKASTGPAWAGAHLAEFDRDETAEEATLEETAAERRARERAEKEIAASQARRASDFAELKPVDLVAEDFDTSVANDPKSWGVSKQAAVEKRQEFSLAMGAHMENLRRAAVAEHTNYQSLLDSMPVEDAKYVGELAEQERRFGNRRTARSLSLFAAGEELSRRLYAAACRQYLTDRVVPTGYAAKAPSDKPRKRSVCLLLSDLHIGADLSGRENPQGFGPVEEARRLEYIMRQAIDYKPQYREDSELVVMLNGDLIEGLLLHDMRDGAPLTEQKIAFQTYLESMLGEFARAYPSVRVYCQPGNHGRDKLRHPGRATSAKWDGHETMMYYGLHRACRALPNVGFDIGFRAVTKINLHGSWFGLSHGDTEVKLGDPDTKAKENLAILDKINATHLYGVEFSGWGFGHFHKPRYVPARPRVLFNGPLIPPNGHARGAGYFGDSCGQWLWESVEGYPIGDVRFIEVGVEQDRDERLGTIVKPFRFDIGSEAQIASIAERDAYRQAAVAE